MGSNKPQAVRESGRKSDCAVANSAKNVKKIMSSSAEFLCAIPELNGFLGRNTNQQLDPTTSDQFFLAVFVEGKGVEALE